MSYYTIFFKCSASIYEKTYYYLAGGTIMQARMNNCFHGVVRAYYVTGLSW